jgi:transglutaminase-like putative cysteine protease
VNGSPGEVEGQHETSRTETVAITGGAAVTAVAAIAAMGTKGLLPVPVTVLAALLAVVAAVGPVRWPSGPGAELRRRLAAPVLLVCFLLTGLVLLARLRAAGGDPARLVEGIGTTVSYTVAALIVVQLASAVTLRNVGTTLIGGALAAVLSIGTTPDAASVDLVSGFGICLLLGWASGIVTLWLLLEAKQRLAVHHVMPGGRRPWLRTPAQLVVVPVVIALLALAVLPDPDGIRGDGLSGGAGDQSGSRTEQSAARSPESYLGGSMDLNSRGDLPKTELAEVPADSPDLWGAGQMDVYTGAGWEVSGPREVSGVPSDATGERDLRTRPAGRALAAADADRVDAVRPLAHDVLLPLLVPGEPVGVRLDGVLVAYLGSFIPYDTGGAYVIRSRGAIVDPVVAADVALPASLPARVRQLAYDITRDAPTVLAKVAAIEAYLETTMRYRLDSPVPGPGEDAVDHFLFESKEGFCEHFAAAEAVLLRAVGVPTRIVTGFAGGATPGDVRVLRGTDAHAWVQVHAGDGRWLWTDPTAGTTLAGDSETADRVLDFLRNHRWLLGGLVLGLVLLGAAAVLLVRRVRARRAAALAAAAPLTTKVLVAYSELESALRGTPLARAPDSSVADLQRTLSRRWPGGLPEEARVTAALETVQRILYDAATVPDERTADALSALRTATDRAAELKV